RRRRSRRAWAAACAPRRIGSAGRRRRPRETKEAKEPKEPRRRRRSRRVRSAAARAAARPTPAARARRRQLLARPVVRSGRLSLPFIGAGGAPRCRRFFIVLHRLVSAHFAYARIGQDDEG